MLPRVEVALLEALQLRDAVAERNEVLDHVGPAGVVPVGHHVFVEPIPGGVLLLQELCPAVLSVFKGGSPDNVVGQNDVRPAVLGKVGDGPQLNTQEGAGHLDARLLAVFENLAPGEVQGEPVDQKKVVLRAFQPCGVSCDERRRTCVHAMRLPRALELVGVGFAHRFFFRLGSPLRGVEAR